MKSVIDVNSIVPMHVTSKKGPQSLRRCLSVKQIGLILHVTLYEQVVFALVTCHAEVTCDILFFHNTAMDKNSITART